MDGVSAERPQPFKSLDTSVITNEQDKGFAEAWLAERNLNRGCYELIDEFHFDVRPAEGFTTARENLTYQIKVHDNFLKCMKEKELTYGKHYAEIESELRGLTREQLLERLDELDERIVRQLAVFGNNNVKVPWENLPVSFAEAALSLRSHEIYHIQTNRSLLRHFGIPEFPQLSETWG